MKRVRKEQQEKSKVWIKSAMQAAHQPIQRLSFVNPNGQLVGKRAFKVPIPGQLGPATIGGRPASARGHAAFTPFFNACGVPACSVPIGKAQGLPVGIQVVAPRLEDVRVLSLANLIEKQQDRTS